MLSGSRRCVPPTESANTISWLMQSFVEYASQMDIRIVSQWDDGLSQVKYDHERYLHIMPNMIKRLERWVALLPYRVRKWLFGIADQKVIAYYLGQALLVRRVKPDLVIVHVSYPLFRISRFLNPCYKHVYYFHSSNLADFLPEFIRDLYRHANGLISICQVAVDEIQAKYGLLPMPSGTIHNGVNTEMFNMANVSTLRAAARQKFGVDEDALVVLYAGRIHPQKGVDKIIEACLSLRTRYPNLVLLLAGDEFFERSGDLSFGHKLRQDVRKYGQDAVRFLGWLSYSQLLDAYASADICALASLETEGNSMFLLEAMACGLPVVSTAVGGVPEIVLHGETGSLIDSQQDITVGLTQAIGSLLEDDTLRRRLGMQAAQRISVNFTSRLMTGKLETYLIENNLI